LREFIEVSGSKDSALSTNYEVTGDGWFDMDEIRFRKTSEARMVPKFLRLPMLVFSVFALGGCTALAGLFGGGGGGSNSAAAPAGRAATTSAPSILDQVEVSTKLAMFSPAALLDGKASLDPTIVDSQCRFRSADPPFLVPTTTANKNWTFNGRVNQSKPDDGVVSDAQRSSIVVGSGSDGRSSSSTPGR
jgi:hypothetical protein